MRVQQQQQQEREQQQQQGPAAAEEGAGKEQLPRREQHPEELLMQLKNPRAAPRKPAKKAAAAAAAGPKKTPKEAASLLVETAARALAEAKQSASAEAEAGVFRTIKTLAARQRVLQVEIHTLDQRVKAARDEVFASRLALQEAHKEIEAWEVKNQYGMLMNHLVDRSVEMLTNLSRLREERRKRVADLKVLTNRLNETASENHLGSQPIEPAPLASGKKRKRDATAVAPSSSTSKATGAVAAAPSEICPGLELLVNRIERCIVYDRERHFAYSEAVALMHAIKGAPAHPQGPSDYRSPTGRFDIAGVRFVVDGRTITVFDGQKKRRTDINNLARMLTPEAHDFATCTYCNTVFTAQARELESVFRSRAACAPVAFGEDAPSREVGGEKDSGTSGGLAKPSAHNGGAGPAAAAATAAASPLAGPNAGNTPAKASAPKPTSKTLLAKSSSPASAASLTPGAPKLAAKNLTPPRATSVVGSSSSSSSSSIANAATAMAKHGFGKPVTAADRPKNGNMAKTSPTGPPRPTTASTAASAASLDGPGENDDEDDEDDEDDDYPYAKKTPRRRGARLGSRARTYDPEFKAMVLDMYDQLGDNKSMTHLARQLNIPRPNISKWVKHADKIREAVRFRKGTRDAIHSALSQPGASSRPNPFAPSPPSSSKATLKSDSARASSSRTPFEK